MSLIDEIATGKTLLSTTVEAWGGKTIYYYPFTLADTDYATKMSKGKDGEFIAYTIIRKVLDENGNKHFTVKDKQRLMNGVDPEILSDLVIEMKGGDDEEDDGKSPEEKQEELGND